VDRYVQNSSSVKVIFLSPNATAVLQPVDTGIIESCTGFCSQWMQAYLKLDGLFQGDFWFSS
jgi:hypothetical protein